MDLKILDKKDNPLLHRLEIEAGLVVEGPTPSNKDVAKELAKQLKADENLVIVKHIYSRFGTNKADVLAYVYNDKDKMKEIEMIKEAPKKEKKEEEKEAPKEETKAEKPAEPKPPGAEEKKPEK